ncbi:TonB-dependent receptor [Hydrocarboniphaga sp.]|uniref:TonB-dependent receptor n=1 Tax=Hydrocarboniphaga sp. TaxID=2033016 RepID=UPI003D12E024
MSERKHLVSSLRLLAGGLGISSALAVTGFSYAQAEEVPASPVPATQQNDGLPEKAPTPSAQQSEGGLEEIIVTAERRSSDVQKTATAVSVRSGEDLLEQGKTTVRQILEDIPAVVVNENQGTFVAGSDTAGNNVVIRGIQANNPGGSNTSPPPPTTAIYTDGVYEGIGGGYDLDRVEVLRGPQGTLYGRSATSGVVSTYNKNPTFDRYSMDGTAEFGSYALQHYTGAVNVPVSDTFAVRIAADEYLRDGYDSDVGGSYERNSARLKMLFKPSEDLSVLFGAAYQKNHTHTGGESGKLTDANTFDYVAVPVRGGQNTFDQYWLDINWNLGPATLTYLPSLRRWDQNAQVYQDGPGGGGLNQSVKTPFDQFQTHELHLASNDDGAIKWLFGGFYYDNRLRSTNDIRWDSSGGLLNHTETEKETSNTGVFGEVTYSFLDRWRLTGGLRYDYTNVQTVQDYTNNLNYACNTPIASGTEDCPAGPPNSPAAGTDANGQENNSTLSLTGEDGTRRFYNTTYKLRLEHDLTDSNLLYTMVSTGFLPGDVQVTATSANQPVASEYGTESLTAYEFGSKNRFLENRLQLNGSAFFYDYGGFRTSIRPDPTNPGTQILVTVPVKVLGAELEMLYQLTPRDLLSLNYSYADAYVHDAEPLYTDNVAEKHDLPGAVPHTFNTAYTHTFPLPGGSALDFRADAHYRSSHMLDNVSAGLGDAGLKFTSVGGEWTGNLSSTWLSSEGKYSVTGYVRNVTDNRYKTYVQLQSLPNDFNPDPVATGTQYDPRTFGIVLSARY